MNTRPTALLALAFLLYTSCHPSQTKQDNESTHAEPAVTLEEHEAEKRIDVLIDGQLFTSYRWPDSVYKPILYPIISAGGHIVTRGFPLDPREGERQDHRHQVGNWLNYGDVNGNDFWGNGHTGTKSPNGGTIVHVGAKKTSEGPGEAVLETASRWVDSTGNELMSEKTQLRFAAEDSIRIIDRITTLTATAAKPVLFKDTKEGMFGIRVARSLELPSEDDKGMATGNYRSSEGISGAEVWGTRARWMDLYGNVDNEKVALIICDHPDNIGYPTYWHARGYGLFAANPLGQKDFTEGRQEMNFQLAPGDSVTFRYRVVIASGAYPDDAMINAWADDFAKIE